ncbi:MAG: hypothetical protein U9R48_02685 [Chloroflexota bacterium]|nr:hypothetical protein [Chloroflexota bacterium]
MTHPEFRRLLTGIAMALVFVALALIAGQVSADGVTPCTIERELMPVLVTGSELPMLQGAPADSLFVYRYWEGGWEQIPFQVDRVVGGVYTDTEGPLGPEDEIALMASDLGDLPSPVDITSTLDISPTWYQIEVTDPLTPTHKGWAYVVRSSNLTQTFTQTYASFDAENNRITADRYVLGFAEGHPIFEYFALNNSDVDILDRTKIRAQTLFGPMTENDIPVDVSLVKDGPVRVIAVQGAVIEYIGYPGLIQTGLAYDLSTIPFGVESVRLSMDFNSNVVTSTFYNTNTLAGGVTIDGNDDPVALTPVSTWWQVSGETGTLVQVADLSGVGGTKTNYYKDDDALDDKDTGDQRSYGDTGIEVISPRGNIVYSSQYAILPPNQPNLGSDGVDRLLQPLQVETTMGGPVVHLYLPVVMKHWVQ